MAESEHIEKDYGIEFKFIKQGTRKSVNHSKKQGALDSQMSYQYDQWSKINVSMSQPSSHKPPMIRVQNNKRALQTEARDCSAVVSQQSIIENTQPSWHQQSQMQ